MYALRKAESRQGVVVDRSKRRVLCYCSLLPFEFRKKEDKRYVPGRRARACSKEGVCWILCLACVYFVGLRKEQAFFQTIQSLISFLAFPRAVVCLPPIQSLSWVFQGFMPLRYPSDLFPRFSQAGPLPAYSCNFGFY